MSLVLLAACTGGDAPPRSDPLSFTPRPSLARALEAEGFAVGVGEVSFDAVANCCDAPTCLHVNPEGEYGTWLVPAGPGEYTGDRYPDEEGRILSWRLRHDEGMLFVGRPPPGVRYTSFRSYRHDRTLPSGLRVPSFDSLGDTLNHLVWDQNPDGTLLVVTTANQLVLDAVDRAADAAGLPAVNLDRIPADEVTLGLDAGADGFHATYRLAGFDDPAAMEAYRDAPDALVYRLTPATGWAQDPIPRPPYRETVARPDPRLDDAVERLRQAILETYAGWSLIEGELTVSEPPLDAPCWYGCNRDVSYTTAPDAYVREDARLVVYGVDPVTFGAATWTAIVVHGLDNSDAAAEVDTTKFAGTSASWLPGDPAEANLFAWTFARDCTGLPECTELPYECPGIGVLEQARVVWRHYLDPATGAFPPNEGLGPRGAILVEPVKTP